MFQWILVLLISGAGDAFSQDPPPQPKPTRPTELKEERSQTRTLEKEKAAKEKKPYFGYLGVRGGLAIPSPNNSPLTYVLGGTVGIRFFETDTIGAYFLLESYTLNSTPQTDRYIGLEYLGHPLPCFQVFFMGLRAGINWRSIQNESGIIIAAGPVYGLKLWTDDRFTVGIDNQMFVNLPGSAGAQASDLFLSWQFMAALTLHF